MFACFVDFRKAFDSVWHTGLFLKMQKSGISGRFYKIIKEMYLSSTLCVKTAGGLTPSFPSNIGVRQGCSLSPLLFNIFISDLTSSLDSGNCKPVELSSKKLSHLLYADDLVIISESPSGLQSSLDALHKYCRKWKLSINTDKTKVVIFSNFRKSSNQSVPLFKIGENSIEVVEQYKYLGVIFSSNGSLNLGKALLEKKARRALFGLHSYLSDHSLPPICSLNLYQKIIQPIASYGSEVWAPYYFSLNGVLKKKCSIFDKFIDSPGAKCLLKFCKRLLGVHEKSVNLAVLGELGQIPPIVNTLTRCINFWLHILQSSTDSILYDAYVSSYKDFYDNNKDKWLQLIKFLCLNFSSLTPTWENHQIDSKSVRKVLFSFKQELVKGFMSFWSVAVSDMVNNNGPNGGRLSLFSSIKPVFGYEEYLSKIHNTKHRYILTRLRS